MYDKIRLKKRAKRVWGQILCIVFQAFKPAGNPVSMSGCFPSPSDFQDRDPHTSFVSSIERKPATAQDISDGLFKVKEAASQLPLSFSSHLSGPRRIIGPCLSTS
jgi:hypothetical protein